MWYAVVAGFGPKNVHTFFSLPVKKRAESDPTPTCCSQGCCNIGLAVMDKPDVAAGVLLMAVALWRCDIKTRSSVSDPVGWGG